MDKRGSVEGRPKANPTADRPYKTIDTPSRAKNTSVAP